MRQLKYLGSKTSIGRFGIVNYGDIIEATEDEYACVKGDKRFKLVGGSVNGESKVLAAGLLPFGTNYFDLRTIPWEAENVSARLNARFSRYQLKCVIEAMKFIGAVVPEVDLEGDKIFIVDAIVTAAYNMRWDSLSEQLRHKLPHVTASPDGTVSIPSVSISDLEVRLPLQPTNFRNRTTEPVPVKRAESDEDSEQAQEPEGSEDTETEAAVIPAPRKRARLSKNLTKNAPRKRTRK